MTADQRAGGLDFAALLRQRRRAAGLTQAELAGLAGLAVRTVREVERGRTTRPQRTTAVLLADALGLTGEERAGFLGAARGHGASSPVPRPRAVVPRRVSLPPVSGLVGRDAELARLAEAVTPPGGAGPVALVGVAGVGKSALAFAVAHRVADRFPGGVAAVVVDHHSTASDVVDAVAVGFGVPRHDELAGATAGGERALLVMDAVDRAPHAVRAALAQLPPAVLVLTTGRAPLGVPGERLWPLTPLELPPAGMDADLTDVARYPAVALFLDRLARVRTVPLAPDEVPALVGLVRRLGGLPLALELAAAHGRLLRLPEILQRYGDRALDLGDDDTLREAVAGSYRLLSEEEQRALRWLAAFRDRWSVELAEQLLAVAGGPAGRDPVPLLDRLISLGLVGVRDSHEHRFRLVDLVRDFATEQAEQQGEWGPARRAHAAVIARLAARLAPALAGPGQPAAMARLDRLAGEIWAALNHAANDDPPTALRLAASLPRWWRFRGRDVAGRRWLRRLLDDPRTAAADPMMRAWAMVGLARLAHEHGAGAEERPAAELALAEFRRLDDRPGELAARKVLSLVCLADGRYDEAQQHCLAVLTVATRHGRTRDAAVAQLGLTWHEIRGGDLAAAHRRLAATDRLAAQAGDRRLRLLATAYSAEVARLAGRYEESITIGRRVLARLDELGDRSHRLRALATVGQALAAQGRVPDAERVLARLRADAPPAAGLDPMAGASWLPQVPGSVQAGPGRGAAEAMVAAIEARLATARGEPVVAAEWWSAAAAALRGERGVGAVPGGAGLGGRAADHGYRRGLVEALAELAACLPDPTPERDEVLAELAKVCSDGGFTLLDRERALLSA
jgi:predicted ATPase/transcriptional regulator with XRE-family HTH domain